MINMADYWPSLATGYQLLVQDATVAWGADTLTILHRYHNGSSGIVLLDDYDHPDGWLDTWSYVKDPARGMLEISDKYPGGKNLVLKPGKEIPWGGMMNVGDVVSGNVEVNVAASTGVTAGPGNYGYQSVTLSEVIQSFTNDGGLVFPNVAKISVFQSWCKTPACDYPAGQNAYTFVYWMAPGKGFIQIDYLTAPSPFTPRRDYAKSITETVCMPGVAI